MVRKAGLEPARREAQPPQDCVSTSSTTSALRVGLKATKILREVVGATGLEPVASFLSGMCSNQLSYAPLHKKNWCYTYKVLTVLNC